jgi:hypothetical protein
VTPRLGSQFELPWDIRPARLLRSQGIRIVDEYDVFCRELTGLVAERLAGQPVTRQTLITAFRGALDALSPPDVAVAKPETGEVPSDIAEIFHWFAASADAKKP